MFYYPHVVIDPLHVQHEIERVRKSELSRDHLERMLALANVQYEATNAELRRMVDRQRIINSNLKEPFETVLGIPFREVAPGELAYVQTDSQIPFRPTRLAVDPEIAPHFVVDDFRIGAVSGKPNSLAIPATLFPPIESIADAKEREHARKMLTISFHTMSVCQKAILLVRNTSDEPREFRGAYWGYGLEP